MNHSIFRKDGTAQGVAKQRLNHGFSLIANKTLANLNAEYFTPVGRTLPEDQVFKLEHFVVAKSYSL